MEPARLFLERCAQIERLMKSQAEIDMLDLAAALRQLLLDDHPLVHKVNAVHPIKLTFNVGTFRNEPDQFTEVLSLEDGLDPDIRPPGSPSKQVNFDGFIGHKILYLKGVSHTVRDVIKLGSDVAGGVHRTSDPKKKQQLIADYSAKVGIGGLPGAIRQMQAIGRVALKGLEPLRTVIGKGDAANSQ